MNNIFIINAHEPSEYSPGRLNESLVQAAQELFEADGREVRTSRVSAEWDVEAEIKNHQWADAIIIQSPVNWMGVPWSFKKYMDDVYTKGSDGRIYHNDGRSRSDPAKQYGTGGALGGTKYMLSLTFNAPKFAFNDPAQTFFSGGSVDDLFWPMHLALRFLGMEGLQTFVCYDVLKNPDIENDFRRHADHVRKTFTLKSD